MLALTDDFLQWSACPDLSAGDFCPGVPRGLRGKIIRRRMEDDCPADDLADGKSIRQKHPKRFAAVCKQRRHISRVGRMRTTVRIVVAQGGCEGISGVALAFFAAVDVEAKNIPAARLRVDGQAGYFGSHEHAGSRLIKPHDPGNAGICFAPGYHGLGIRPPLKRGHISPKSICSLHRINSLLWSHIRICPPLFR